MDSFLRVFSIVVKMPRIILLDINYVRCYALTDVNSVFRR